MTTTFVEQLAWSAGPAIAISDGSSALSYEQLSCQSARAATAIRARWGHGGYVVVKAQSTVDFVATLLGVMFSGNCPVPVNPETPASDLEYIVGKSAALGVLEPIPAADLAGLAETRDPAPQLPTMVLFTSGTTGYPKGSVVSHANLIHSCSAMAEYLRYREFPSAAVVLPLYYSYGLLSQVLCQLTVGGKVRLISDFRNVPKFAAIVNDEGLQTFCGVPSTYHTLAMFHGMSPLSMPGVRILCSAGAALDRSRFQDIKSIFPNSTFFNNYGMTEAAPRISYISEDDERFHQNSCGRPMRGVEVRIVDPETHVPLPEGEAGMLVVRGANVTAGYLNDAAVTRRAFTADGWLISGDIARMDAGYITITGRHDDIFNSGGEKVAPLEIERVLALLPGVEAAAVTGILDERRGMIPVAFLKLQSPLNRRQILQELKGKLVAAKIPQRFFEVSGFPMTANGKLQRRRLDPGDGTHVLREIL
jgi:acyl-CoA synthetase (AMP-forming)/AMP-acid ligase II